jgi:hypothetical protein
MLRMAFTAASATAVFAPGPDAAPGNWDGVVAHLSRTKEASVGVGLAGRNDLVERLMATPEKPGR